MFVCLTLVFERPSLSCDLLFLTLGLLPPLVPVYEPTGAWVEIAFSDSHVAGIIAWKGCRTHLPTPSPVGIALVSRVVKAILYRSVVLIIQLIAIGRYMM